MSEAIYAFYPTLGTARPGVEAQANIGMCEAADVNVAVARMQGEAGVARKLVVQVAAGVACAAVVLGIVGNKIADGNDKDTQAITEESVAVDCEDSSFARVASSAMQYESKSFLPKLEVIDNKKKVQPYIDRLFDKNGPLGGKIDIGSLAALGAVVGEPSHDGKTTDPNYDYFGTFSRLIAEYQAADGLDKAEDDCQQLKETLSQTAEYNGNWAQKGDVVTEMVALRDLENNIVGMDFIEGPVTLDTLRGIEVKLRQSTKGLDGFISILIDDVSKKIYIKGITIGKGGKATIDELIADNPAPDAPPKLGKTAATTTPAGPGIVGNTPDTTGNTGTTGSGGAGCGVPGKPACPGSGPGTSGPGVPVAPEGTVPAAGTTPTTEASITTRPPASTTTTTQETVSTTTPTTIATTTTTTSANKGNEPPQNCEENPFLPECS
ncbi:MAG: hypothetical protein V4702_01985 [Patescibacteria group bacterium]